MPRLPSLLSGLALAHASICHDPKALPAITPPPKDIALQPFSASSGPERTELELTEKGTGIFFDEALRPLAALLSEQFFTVGGLRLQLRTDAAQKGDIVLKQEGEATKDVFDKDAERYSITVDGNGVDVRCKSYRGCAWAVASLVQSVCTRGVPVPLMALPAMAVKDFPDAPYRAIMVDTARRLVEVSDLFDAAFFAHYYKIPYLHLHMTDDHGWSFPSSAFPALGSQNVGFRGPAPVVFKKQDLVELVAYAEKLGVAVIPELEGPSHSAAMRRSEPKFQGVGGLQPGEGGCINAADEAVYEGMTTIVKEMAEIFTTAPFMHVGCDETSTPASLPGFKNFTEAHQIKDAGDLFSYYVKFMAETVKKVGKKAMIWGPASLGRLEKGDAVLLAWQGSVNDARAAVEKGLFVVNAPNSGGNSSKEFNRSLYDFGDPNAAPTRQVLNATELLVGTQVNIWECGWRFAQGRIPYVKYDASYLDQAVARASGPGWWAASSLRAADAFVGNYSMADRNRILLRPSYASKGAAAEVELRV